MNEEKETVEDNTQINLFSISEKLPYIHKGKNLNEKNQVSAENLENASKIKILIGPGHSVDTSRQEFSNFNSLVENSLIDEGE
jgi:hypothetical protein